MRKSAYDPSEDAREWDMVWNVGDRLISVCTSLRTIQQYLMAKLRIELESLR